MPGPPPKPDATRRRRNPTAPMTALPAAGRSGPPPPWPLAGPAPRAWTVLWATPQAAAWAPMGAGVLGVVARYVSMLARVELPEVAAEVRLLEDRLGLSPVSMLRLRWAVSAEDSDDVPEPPRRLRVVDDPDDEKDLTMDERALKALRALDGQVVTSGSMELVEDIDGVPAGFTFQPSGPPALLHVPSALRGDDAEDGSDVA